MYEYQRKITRKRFTYYKANKGVNIINDSHCNMYCKTSSYSE